MPLDEEGYGSAAAPPAPSTTHATHVSAVGSQPANRRLRLRQAPSRPSRRPHRFCDAGYRPADRRPTAPLGARPAPHQPAPCYGPGS